MLNSFSNRAAAAYQHDGTVNSARALFTWVHSGEYSKADDPVEGSSYTRAQMTTPDGKEFCLNGGDWLVWEPSGTFKHYTDAEFQTEFVPLAQVNEAHTTEDLIQLVHKGPEEQYNPIRVSEQDIDNIIRSIQYHTFPNTSVTVCMVTLLHGFVIVAHHVCNDGSHPTNLEYCRQAALTKARQNIATHLTYNKLLANPKLDESSI